MKYITTVGNEQFTVDINQQGEVTVDGAVINVNLAQMRDTTMFSMLIGNQSHDIRLSGSDTYYEVQVMGDIFDVVVEDERTRRLTDLAGDVGRGGGEVFIKAPMPGVVVEVPVSRGQQVSKGDVILILESMKMQNEFTAPRDGQIRAVRVASGDTVAQNAVMLSLI